MESITRYLKNGSELVKLSLPAESDLLEIDNPTIEIDKSSFTNSLKDLLPPTKDGRLSIVVSDKTRLCGYELYLPWVLEVAESKGYNKNNITIFIAYGTHPKQTESESLKTYGESFNHYKFVHHNCDDADSMINIGFTKAGTPVTIRKELNDSDAILLFGAISHHYFAGYGGGRKLIFPGLASREAIYKNHKLFIDFEGGLLNHGCQSGVLAGNPVAEDLEEADSYSPEKIIISGILNKSGEVTRLLFAKDYAEFTSACKKYDSFYRKKDTKQYDLVIASSGGFPKDINFIQTHKSIHNAASFVKDGGTLILLGECRDGLGNENFIGIFDQELKDAVKSLKSNYSGNGGTALSMMTKTERIKINMVTSLSSETCIKLKVNKMLEEDILPFVEQFSGSIAVIENASIIYR